MSIACGITWGLSDFKIGTYDFRTKNFNYFYSKDKSIDIIIGDLITKYEDDIGIIVVKISDLKQNELENFKKDVTEKYGGLVYLPTTEELDFDYYLTSKVEYIVGELILWLKHEQTTIYQCTETVEKKVTLKELDKRDHEYTKRLDFEYIEKMLMFKMSQVHVVFEDSQEEINLFYGSKLDKYYFKSINFTNLGNSNPEILARLLLSDSELSLLVKIKSSHRTSIRRNFTIEDWGFIHIPKLVKKYEPRTDIMGIDLGSTRSVLTVSRNRQIHVIPVDDSSPGDLWTESVVLFDEKKPIIGRAAVRRLRTKTDHVIFDAKLLFHKYHIFQKSKQSMWPFKYSFKEEQPHFGSITSQGLKNFSLAEINKIFLEKMTEAASEYQDVFNNGNSVRKAVITVPRYSNNYISSTIEAAKLANIEMIDIIEETHADLLYYLSNDRYSEMIKPGKKIAIFDIGGGTCIWKVYEISEHEGKRYANCIRESINNAKYSGRDIDDIIIGELEKSISEDLRSNVKLRTLEAAKKIKHDLSFAEKTEFDLLDIHPRLEGMVEFTREWFEKELKSYFKYKKYFYTFELLYSLPTQRKDRCNPRGYLSTQHDPFNDVDIVFLAGGTCRIPFVQEWIKEQFPKAKMIIDGELEIITATGAAIHALQVLSGEVERYIKLKTSIACCIVEDFNRFKVNIYNANTKESNDLQLNDKSVDEIINELVTKYRYDIEIIVVAYDPDSEPSKLNVKKEDFKKYEDLVHLPTKEELDFNYYLDSKADYSVGESIIKFEDRYVTLYKYTEITKEKVIWKLLDKREYELSERVNFEYAAKMFHLKPHQLHAVFQNSREKVNSLYDSALKKCNFKSINFIENVFGLFDAPRFLARNFVSNQEASTLVKIDKSFHKDNAETFTIEDWGFIHIPKLVKEYEPRTDIMGIDLGSTRSVLAVSRNRQIHVIPVDKSSPGDLWTESVVSFDEEKPIIGKAAVRRLRTKPDHVIFDAKLLCNEHHRWERSKQSMWPFKYSFKEEQPHFGSMTSQGLEDFSLAEINKIFLEKMTESASEYQDVFNNGNSVRKAVITVPRYFQYHNLLAPFISSVVEGAKLANIEVIDIIEETHANLLYYLSNEKYSKMIERRMKIAIFDVGGGTCICRIYEILQHEGKRYANCIRESYQNGDGKYSGRTIDDIIIEELEKLIPENLRSNMKLRVLEEAKKIKHDLSFEEKTEFNLSEIHSRLEGMVQFTRKWFEEKLKVRFPQNEHYYTFKQYSHPTQRKNRCRREEILERQDRQLDDVHIVFLAGGTCRIPFVQEWIRQQFPKAKVVIDGELEIVTATGAAIHALQVLNGDIEPSVRIHNANS